MLEFLFPWTMAAGGALVASPIIIHLINRMRFKRIRWAAMEFLLKSQKRNRRRLIIEQLILLLLRILLVLLIALIVARFIGFAFGMFEPQNRQHIILLDDTPDRRDVDWRSWRSVVPVDHRDSSPTECGRNAVQCRPSTSHGFRRLGGRVGREPSRRRRLIFG